jgi:hypothetical protein
LPNHQHIVHRQPRPLIAFSRGVERRDERRLRRRPRRCEAEDHRGGRGRRHGEGEYRPIDREIKRHANREYVRAGESLQRARHPPRDEHATCAARRSKHEALRQQLPDQLCARGADRCAHRELAAPGAGARQEQAGDVGARDQQHEANRAKQPAARSAEIPIEHGMKSHTRCRHDARGDVLVGDRVFRSQARVNRVDLCACVFDCPSALQAPFHEQPSVTSTREARGSRIVVRGCLHP